jgi:hypothetical protein
MPGRGEEAWGGEDRAPQRSRGGLVAAALAAAARALDAEQDRWFLWLPVVFAGGIIRSRATSKPMARRPTMMLAMQPKASAAIPMSD